MKKALPIILAIVLCACIFASCDNGDAPDGMKLASSDNALYSMYVPEEWQINQSTPAVLTVQVSDTDRTNLSVAIWNMSEGYTSHDDFIAEYKTQIETLFDTKTQKKLDENGQAVLDENGEEVFETISSLKFELDGATTSQIGTYYVDEVDGKKTSPYSARDYLYVGRVNGDYYKFSVTVVADSGTGAFYVITTTYAQDELGAKQYEIGESVAFSSYDTHKDAINNIISTFKIK